MVSPRPSCISAPVSMMASPPSWRMPMSNDTRVRVEGRRSFLMCFQLRLHGVAGRKHVAQLRKRHLVDVEEVARLAHHPAAFNGVFESVAQACSQLWHGWSISALGAVRG